MNKKLGNIFGRTALPMLLALALAGCQKGQETQKPFPKEPAETEVTFGQEPEDGTVQETETVSQAESESPVPLCLSTYRGCDSDWDENTLEQLCSVSWQKLYLEASDAQAYPKLAAWLENMGQEREQGAQDTLEMLREDAKAIQEVTDVTHTLFSRQEIYTLRTDSRCLSFLEFSWIDHGGAHGLYWHSGYTLEPESGRQLQLEEVLTDIERLPKIIAEKLEERYLDTTFFEPLEEVFKQYVKEDKFNWVLTQQGILFLFNPYELSSFAEGTLLAAVSFAEDPELFQSKYREIPERYTVQIQQASPGLFDLNDDGSFEEISVFGALYDQEEACEELRIVIDDREYREEIYAYDIRLYLVHDTAQKRTWLYAQTRENNDYRTIFVYELYPEGEEAVKPIGRLDGFGFHTMQTGEADFGEEIFTNPDHFILESRMELLSTLLGGKEYMTDENGLPRTESEYFIAEYGVELTSKVSLTLKIIDGDIEEETFPAGTAFTYYRTDNESVVDLKTEDGRICRIEAEREGYRFFIDGMDAYEVFDGMIYAG